MDSKPCTISKSVSDCVLNLVPYLISRQACLEKPKLRIQIVLYIVLITVWLMGSWKLSVSACHNNTIWIIFKLEDSSNPHLASLQQRVGSSVWFGQLGFPSCCLTSVCDEYLNQKSSFGWFLIIQYTECTSNSWTYTHNIDFYGYVTHKP